MDDRWGEYIFRKHHQPVVDQVLGKLQLGREAQITKDTHRQFREEDVEKASKREDKSASQ